MASGDFGVAFGVWVAGTAVVAAIAFLVIGRQAARCPNCGQHKLMWTTVGFRSRVDAFTQMGVGAVLVLAGLLGGGQCLGIGLLLGVLGMAAGFLQWNISKGRCRNCHYTAATKEMAQRLSGSAVESAVPAASTSSATPQPRALVECPVCREQIREGATECRFCGAELLDDQG